MKALLCLLATLPLFGTFTDDEYLKRITAHLIIGDVEGATRESREAVGAYPNSEPLKIAHIEALAKSGRDSDALVAWKETGQHHLLETVAWGFLEKGEQSGQLFGRLFSVLSASHTRDVRAVRLILSQMRSTNAFLRTVGIRLAAEFRDEQLTSELKRMLQREKVWYVRLSAIDALGKLGVREVAEQLEEVVASDRSTIEERTVAAEALVTMLSDVNPDPFFISNRAGLRYLACEIVTHLDMDDRCDQVAALLGDTAPIVRIAALRTLGLLGKGKPHRTAIEALVADSHPQVAITAAWLFIQLDQKKGEAAFRQWLSSSDPSLRRIAAGAITRCGKAGHRLAALTLKESKDPYVRVTIAHGLMGQGVEIDRACKTIFNFLQTEPKKIMFDAHFNPHFEYVAPSEVYHTPQMAQYPAYIDQHTRLQLLNILALHRYPQAEEAVKTFLTQRIDGLTYVASMTLLQEGESDALPLIQDLLTDSDDTVRVQAALVLALAGSDPSAITTLQEAYHSVDRETKMNILGALGYLGEKSSIPFLVAQLEEPFQLLRLIAASSLIQCLYH